MTYRWDSEEGRVIVVIVICMGGICKHQVNTVSLYVQYWYSRISFVRDVRIEIIHY
jgi:hypothetical protein